MLIFPAWGPAGIVLLTRLHMNAAVVFCGEVAEGVIGVIATEGKLGEGARVELLRATSFDDQDRALGQGTYCLSLHTGATVYGGVVRWSLASGRLELELTKEASDALRVDTEVTISFKAQHMADLRQWLPKVLGPG